MSNEDRKDEPRVQAETNSVAVGNITVGGDVRDIRIGHTIGYTAERVSALIAQISTTFQPKSFDGRCPYKGLDYFEVEDAELFYGRERSVDDLIGRLRDSRTVFVSGPSGSGKSSLVRAGLIHALKQGALKESKSEGWLYATCKPGRDPFEALKNAFSRLKSPELGNYFIQNVSKPDVLNECAESALSERRDQRLVLFIDQFEEVFTQINREETRGIFLDLLTNAAAVGNGRVILLFAMRSDFVSNCATYPRLNALLNRQFVQIGAMQPEELVSAIAQPALRVGLRIDPDLIAQIINDMQGEPGALPLMQFALKDLFDSQQEKGGLIALTLNDYLQHGGIHKSLERHADSTFTSLDAKEKELARAIFSGLIEVGRGVQDTRRTADFDDLVPSNAQSEAIESIVRKLADARLVTTDEVGGRDTVTISHEKLIDAWPWLKRLVNENREAIALQNDIAEDAKEWEERKRDPSYLYTGGRLANVREQVKKQKLTLGNLSKEFVQAGRARQQRSQAFLISAISLVLIASIAAAVVFRIQAKIARAGDLAGQAIALRDKNLFASLLVGIEAYNLDNNIQTRRVLLDNSQFIPELRNFLSGHHAEVFSVAFSPDGKLLASASRDKSIILWDAASGQSMGRPLTGHSGSVVSVAFSPNGSILASGSTDKTIILWDVLSRNPIGQPLTEHTGRVYSVTFSPNGRMLASGSEDKTIILWDVQKMEPISELTGHEGTITTIAFSPDGRFLASGGTDSKIYLWNLESDPAVGQPLIGHKNAITSVAFSPDGRMIASGSADQTIIFWDVENRVPVDQPLSGHEGYITGISFSPDGDTLISGSVDRTLILWDVKTRKQITDPLAGHSNWVRSVTFSPDGQTIASAGSDNMVILWELHGRSPISQWLPGHKKAVYSVAGSPDGGTIASGSGDESIILWNAETGQPVGTPLVGGSGTINSIAFSPDGRVLASANDDHSVTLWDVERHKALEPRLTGHEKAVYVVAFSPDGRILASGGADKKIILWDMQTMTRVGELTGHDGALNSLAFSPDGTMLASGSADATVILWDLADRQIIEPVLTGHEGAVRSVAFRPDGNVLASGGDDLKIILWTVEDHQPIKAPLTYQSGFIYSVAFSPDGRILASGSYQNSVQLWDVENIENPSPLGEPLADERLTISSLSFIPNGRTLVSGSSNGYVILWALDPQDWIAQICQRVGRSFSEDEWGGFFPNEEYRLTCPQQPGFETEATPQP